MIMIGPQLLLMASLANAKCCDSIYFYGADVKHSGNFTELQKQLLGIYTKTDSRPNGDIWYKKKEPIDGKYYCALKAGNAQKAAWLISECVLGNGTYAQYMSSDTNSTCPIGLDFHNLNGNGYGHASFYCATSDCCDSIDVYADDEQVLKNLTGREKQCLGVYTVMDTKPEGYENDPHNWYTNGECCMQRAGNKDKAAWLITVCISPDPHAIFVSSLTNSTCPVGLDWRTQNWYGQGGVSSKCAPTCLEDPPASPLLSSSDWDGSKAEDTLVTYTCPYNQRLEGSITATAVCQKIGYGATWQYNFGPNLCKPCSLGPTAGAGYQRVCMHCCDELVLSSTEDLSALTGLAGMLWGIPGIYVAIPYPSGYRGERPLYKKLQKINGKDVCLRFDPALNYASEWNIGSCPGGTGTHSIISSNITRSPCPYGPDVKWPHGITFSCISCGHPPPVPNGATEFRDGPNVVTYRCDGEGGEIVAVCGPNFSWVAPTNTSLLCEDAPPPPPPAQSPQGYSDESCGKENMTLSRRPKIIRKSSESSKNITAAKCQQYCMGRPATEKITHYTFDALEEKCQCLEMEYTPRAGSVTGPLFCNDECLYEYMKCVCGKSQRRLGNRATIRTMDKNRIFRSADTCENHCKQYVEDGINYFSYRKDAKFPCRCMKLIYKPAGPNIWTGPETC